MVRTTSIPTTTSGADSDSTGVTALGIERGDMEERGPPSKWVGEGGPNSH